MEKPYEEPEVLVSRSNTQQVESRSSTARKLITHITLLFVLLGVLYYFADYEYYRDAALNFSEKIHRHCGHRLSKRKEFTETIGFRVLVGIGVFAVLNVIVIVVHHIVQKIARSTNSYKSIDHVVSPF
ncbi:hypothetical protein FT663_01328 [Candidozyma haemuli var. vulneris]|uniref:Uncharacterized protein n=1 Tax=Candidozyma haemuli TaxID=45357 RepID=A0A2V1AZG6_9ASCO|nr:hypothetical protein CXQ85_002482 [[Candida] haemuloni]KAF3993917.1 hypothetical protein FT662_00365 [[Candida] haemuloni var. vulneris]KAF3994528.1 hypothetical protein FT663_01328 [[Candida] haemuloni var. vulneris]PVH22763.1 hypothetical protein CXQ85_002482 [[Candida] haemuloni]